jgi:hypothetical protein
MIPLGVIMTSGASAIRGDQPLLDPGLGGPMLGKWVRQLLRGRDERKRRRSVAPPTNDRRQSDPRPQVGERCGGRGGKREPQELTQRLRFPGGWLYRTIKRGAEDRARGFRDPAACNIICALQPV